MNRVTLANAVKRWETGKAGGGGRRYTTWELEGEERTPAARGDTALRSHESSV